LSEVQVVRFIVKPGESSTLSVLLPGRAGVTRFVDGAFSTGDPVLIQEMLESARRETAGFKLDPDCGTYLCPECFGTFKSEFGLQGHMRTHGVNAFVESVEEENGEV
jgi:hypothetical protein